MPKKHEIDDATLASARLEAKRRMAATRHRDAIAQRHRKKNKAFLDAVNKALAAIPATFEADDEGADRARAGLHAALDALLIPPLTVDEFDDPAPKWVPAAVGPNRGLAPSELEEMIVSASERRAAAEVAGCADLVRRTDVRLQDLRATLEATRSAGITDLTVANARVAEARRHDEHVASLKGARDAQVERWRRAVSLAAQPAESPEIVTTRVLEEQGHAVLAACKAAFDLDGGADQLRESAEYQQAKRAVAAARRRLPPEVEAECPDDAARDATMRVLIERGYSETDACRAAFEGLDEPSGSDEGRPVGSETSTA